MFDPKITNNDLNLISPFFKRRLEAALKEVWDAGYNLFVFEGWRSPSRQSYLYEQGRTREGKIVTNAKGWSSFHQFGCAVDLVYKLNNRWSWEGDFDKPSVIMMNHGFEWGGKWGDRPHYQMTGSFSIQECKAIVDQHGVQVLWLVIEDKVLEKTKNKLLS